MLIMGTACSTLRKASIASPPTRGLGGGIGGEKLRVGVFELDELAA